ncbi:MAG: hypothetical protein R3B97_05725 [Dehalococcoidia bacterium]|nr:hypothetical protein [Dehalococcoidia bacterium]
MTLAFKQRRNQIVADSFQLKTDIDSYNENQQPPVALQMSFDLTDDLEELAAARRVA